MQEDYWHNKWAKNELGFHQSDVHSMLARFFKQVGDDRAGRVFVPLCGKSLDMVWLAQQGYKVVGVELSEVAAQQFFDEAGLMPQVKKWAGGKHYLAGDIEIFVGDVFHLTADILGEVNAVYDRAALVALPHDMRRRYAEHTANLTGNAPQLAIVFNYDQNVMSGPPFSIPDEEINELFGANFLPELLFTEQLEGDLKGIVPAIEKAWHLVPR